MGRHSLAERGNPGEALALTARICGLHAQLISSAELSLWARIDEFESEAVRCALWEERTLVKTWAMRGTLHLLPASELGLWLGALGSYDHYLKPAWLRGFGVTRAELDLLLEAIRDALGGDPLTREELVAAVARQTGSAAVAEKLKGSWGSLLKPAAFSGGLCFGPSRGRNVTFTRPDRWVGAVQAAAPDEALRQVAVRFLGVNGPATREDLARWWATTPAKAGALIESLGDEVERVEIEGAPAWILREHLAETLDAGPSRTVRLAPAFDQYVVGATLHAASLLPGAVRDRVYRAQGWLSPVLLVDGRIEGVWKQERKGSRVSVRIEPFGDLPAWARRGAELEGERLARFLDGELALSWGPLER